MLQDVPSTRSFTVKVSGTAHCLSVDCRAIRTIRDVLLLAIPTPPPSSSSLSLSSSLPHHSPIANARRDTGPWWIDSCVCTFAGQRMALTMPSEWAPTELSVSWDAQGAGLSAAARPSRRRRQRYVVKEERDVHSRNGDERKNILDDDDDDDDDDDESVDSSSSSSSRGNGDSDKRTLQQCHRSYWLGVHDSGDEDTHKNKNNSNSINNVMNSSSDSEDDKEDQSADGSDVDNDVVFPIVVGGVVRLINTESREKSHQWTVYIRGLFNETDYLTEFIESVQFVLDPSFTPSERRVTTAPFELTEVGWGEFVVKMRVQLRHYPRPLRLAFTAGKRHADVNALDAAALFSASASVPLAGFSRGPTLSPVVDLLSRRLSSPVPIAPAVKRRRVESIKKEQQQQEDEDDDDDNNDYEEEEEEEKEKGKEYAEAMPDPKGHARAGLSGAVRIETQCPGVVTLSHLLRFSHRPRRGHCIPPAGRPYEPDEHIGYTLVEAPVVTEHYDEIVIPDAPTALREATAKLPDLFRRRIAIVKSAAAQQRNNNNNGTGDIGDSSGSGKGAPHTRSAAFSERGVTCWRCIAAEEPDDAALAESFLESVGIPLLPPQLAEAMDAAEAPRGLGAADSAALLALRPGRGRRKLTGAEIDLVALRNARRGLEEAIEKMRREIAARHSAQIFQHYK